MKLYAKINGVVTTRDVTEENVAEHVKRGWSEKAPAKKKPAAKKAD